MNRPNLAHDGVERCGHQLMHRFGLMSLYKIGPPTVADEEMREILVIHTRKHRGIRDLISIEMKNRQHRAIARRIQKFVAMPAGG